MASDADLTRNDMLVVGDFLPFSTPSRGFRQFHKDLPNYHASRNPPNEGTINFWLAARVFETVAGTQRSLDAQTILQAMSTTVQLDTGGITADLRANPFDQPQLSNRYVFFATTRNGRAQPLVRRYFDPFLGIFTDFVDGS